MIQSKVVTIAGKSGISPRTIREIPGKKTGTLVGTFYGLETILSRGFDILLRFDHIVNVAERFANVRKEAV